MHPNPSSMVRRPQAAAHATVNVPGDRSGMTIDEAGAAEFRPAPSIQAKVCEQIMKNPRSSAPTRVRENVQ
jgi:hypothetical protein